MTNPLHDLETLINAATTPRDLWKVMQGYFTLREARISGSAENMRVALDSTRKLAPEAKHGDVWVRLSKAIMMHMGGDKIFHFNDEAITLFDKSLLERATTTGQMMN